MNAQARDDLPYGSQRLVLQRRIPGRARRQPGESLSMVTALVLVLSAGLEILAHDNWYQSRF